MRSSGVEVARYAATIDILSVGPLGDDRPCLREILDGASPDTGSDCQEAVYRDCGWNLKYCLTPKAAMARLRSDLVPVVVFDNDYCPGGWKEILDKLADFPRPPLLIVTSLHADDRLWVEALNLGAYDVLAKPYDREEVVRTLTMAWQKWENRHALRFAAS